MKDADLIQALKRIKVQTGGLICLGCGHEHNCGVHGCAVIREAAQRLEERMEKGTLELGEPLTQADISQLGYEKIWIEYKDGTGEWALVYAGKIYAIDALEGAGFGDILQDAMQGERLDWPTGQYTAYRRGKERIDPKPSADVAPAVHGTPMLRYRPERHERYEEYGLNENGEMLYLKRVLVDEKSYAMYCPACGKRLCSRFTSFCPNCGAKLDGSEDK